VKGMPVSSLFFICCSMSLCGLPFLSGFYSKDLILELFIVGGINSFILLVTLVGTLFTATYSFRLGGFVFFKEFRIKRSFPFWGDINYVSPDGDFMTSFSSGRVWAFLS